MRIRRCFKKLETEQRKALIPYITVEDPEPGVTVQIMHKLVENGGDIIELGFPFSDPVADGPVIARAHERALSHGVTLNDVILMVSSFRESNSVTPVVLMGYLNPIESMGYELFAQRSCDAGVDGVLVVDLPHEAPGNLSGILEKRGLDIINLIAPTTSDERIRKICNVASGYLYYVSLKGVTGSAALDIAEVERRVRHIKKFTTLPISVGFGIRDGDSAAAISKVADGVIVGSVLVSELEKKSEVGNNCQVDAVGKILAQMRSAMDSSCSI
ncbi:MAG: tryptophan synthase subunit alpha [Candidatus Endonucleobacter bathymodioli]|uniref:Tryptophan synthase alpha chain n=1 Tax=Candidatus Endonucleibacter bathymodioli TaxID=539814 RepID=A0AA90NQX6_9GAMM|nr:tryptophan synthase subunit alpha [Candidatus Endonucleobacter bathymodioli]